MTTIHDSLTKAIAEAREALAKYQDRDARHYLDEAMEGLLAALDAAQPVGVIWRPEPTKPLGVSWRGPMIHTIPHETPLYLAPQSPPAAVPAGYALVPVEPTTAMKCRAVEAWEGPAAYKSIFARGLADLEDEAAECWAAMLAAATQAPPVAVANVTPLRQPRADLARLVESINAAVYANGDGLSVTEAIGALELAKLELLKGQEQ